jgi:HK97 family phage portal protein
MGFVSRVKELFGWGGLEGTYRGPAVGIGELGGAYPIPFGDGFQQNLQLVRGYGARGVPAVYACVMSFARAVAQCYPEHRRTDAAGNIQLIRTSPASRILRRPNSYQTWPQFIYNVCAHIGFEGEALALIRRDDRFAPISFHLCRNGTFMPYLDPESQAIFYSVGDNPIALAGGSNALVPERDVIHFRQYTPRHPLCGESPIKAAALATGVNVALSATQAAFFTNMARPSGVLSTDQTLTRAQMAELRAAFKEQSAGLATGELPILANGLKFQQLAVNSVDAQLIESQRMSVEEIARCFGVPLPLIGDLSKATLNNTETLINLWLSISLGFWLENIERSLDRAFDFGQDDFCELDTAALLRSDFLQRVDGLTKGIQGGLYTPNEARGREGLSPAKGGAEPLLQAQMTPLSMLLELAEKAAKPPPAPVAPKAPANDDSGDGGAADDTAAKGADPVIARALVLARLADKRAAL